jgi:hypothetical protein
MIRIGFDPGLEAQQVHRSLIRENELLRLAQECVPQAHAGWLSLSRMLARLGKEMTNLGMSIEARYSDTADEPVAMKSYDSSSSCSS